MFKIQHAVCALVLAVSAGANAAYDGTVTFDGLLIAETCTVNTDSTNILVKLPTIAVQKLAAAGDEAGSTSFNINVSACPAGLTQVGAHFEAIANEGTSTTNNLTNSSPVAGRATNVEVRLYNINGANAAAKHLKVGTTGAFFPINTAARTATMTYAGGYYATGASTVGPVRAQVQYVLAYP